MVINKDDLIKKYKAKIEREFKQNAKANSPPNKMDDSSYGYETSAYLQFKKDLMPKNLSIYERLCNWTEKIFKINPGEKERKELQKSIDTCHLEITPEGSQSFAMIFPIMLMLFGIIVTFVIPFVLGFEPILFFMFLFIVFGLVLILILRTLPHQLAKKWRVTSSNQMIISIFYLVTYLRHTSNLENAVTFASEHLVGPLALDFKRILWQVENQKYESLSEALDVYLVGWQEYSPEFVESIHLIESSLLETSEDRRLSVLEKSLEVILERTEEKMLHYAQNLRGPINFLHMLGIIMPILGLVIMPLVVSIMGGDIKWYHIAVLYNLILPFIVFYFGRNILSTRPTGYGDTDISEFNPKLKERKSIDLRFFGKNYFVSPLIPSIIVFGILFLIGISPILVAVAMNVPSDADKFPDICFTKSFKPYNPLKSPTFKPIFCLLEYRKQDDQFIGPFGLLATILSIFVVASFGIGIGLYYRLRSKNVIKIRNETKKLETEFSSALFHLGNRMSDGIPPEIAFGKLAESLKGTSSGNFFSRVYYNITRLGKNLDDAIFDSKVGAIREVPSNVIVSSMKVLVESVKKGPKVAALAMINVGEYIKQIHRVDERIKDLMAETISSMKAQIKGLAPGIAAVIVAITSMITFILGRLELANETVEGLQQAGGVGAIFTGGGVPTYHFQIIVGLYIVQLIFLMTQLANTIENGTDKLNEDYQKGNNLVNSTIIYSLIAIIVMFIFNSLAGIILGRV